MVADKSKNAETVESHRREMLGLFAQLKLREGAWPSPVAGVAFIKNSSSYPPTPAFYEPCIVLVAQGMKRFQLPDAVLTYDARHYLIVTVPVPASCEALVGEDGPFLGMAVRIDLQMLADALLQMEAVHEPADRVRSLTAVAASRHAASRREVLRIDAPHMEEEIAGCGVRLLRAMLRPSDAAVLGPLLVREMHYRALNGTAGGMLRALLTGNAARQRIHRILGSMHTDFAAPFHAEQAARDAGMSVSTLHEGFRQVTGTSPLQYLKQLRLHRARTLMVQTEISAAVACETVGYVSQSQFSREFKREFGRSPLEEVRELREMLCRT